MKLLALSDVHLDSTFGWATPDVARRQRQRLRGALTWAFDQAQEQGAAAVLVGGDLFERELVSQDTVAFLHRTFERSGVRVFVAPGNHDYADSGSPYRRGAWPGNVHVFSETRFTSMRLAEGVTIWGAAHRKPVDTPGFFDDGFRVADSPDGASRHNGGGAHVAVFHGEERKAAFQGQHRHAPFDGEQIAAAGFHHAVVGHSHNAADHPTWTRLGALEQLAFGGPWGSAALLEVGNGLVTARRIEQRPAALHSLDVDVTEAGDPEEARAFVAQALAGLTGAARIRLRGEPDDLLLHADDFAARSFEPKGIDQVLIDASALTLPYDFEQIEQEKTVRGMFARRVRGADLDQETERIVLLAGLRALDGRDIGVLDELRMRGGGDASHDDDASDEPPGTASGGGAR